MKRNYIPLAGVAFVITVTILLFSVSMFLLITVIDIVLYGRSFWDTVTYIFDVDFGTKEYYVIVCYLLGLVLTVRADLSRRNNGSEQRRDH